MSQVSLVVEEVAAEEKVYLDMEEVEEVYLDMDEVEVEVEVEETMVAVAAVVEAVEEELITIYTTTTKGRITTMELIHQILRRNLHLKKSQFLFKLMYGMIFGLNEGQIEKGSIIMMMLVI